VYVFDAIGVDLAPLGVQYVCLRKLLYFQVSVQHINNDKCHAFKKSCNLTTMLLIFEATLSETSKTA